MATPAQYKVGEIGWYTNGDKSEELAVAVEITQIEPAQYHIARLKDSTIEVCGEGVAGEEGSFRGL